MRYDDPLSLVGLPVGVTESSHRLRSDERRERRRNWPVLLSRLVDDHPKIPPINQLHHDEQPVRTSPDVEYLDDVLVIQIGRKLCLGDEHPRHLRILGEVGKYSFDRHPLLETLSAGGGPYIQLRHPSAREQPSQSVALVHHLI